MKYFIVVIIGIAISIYTILFLIEPKIINLNDITPKIKYKTTEFISVFDDNNITILDDNNYVKKIAIGDINKIKVQVNSNKRIIIIKNEATKFITNNDTMWIVDKVNKHLSGYMGIEIKDIKINKFYVNKQGDFSLL